MLKTKLVVIVLVKEIKDLVKLIVAIPLIKRKYDSEICPMIVEDKTDELLIGKVIKSVMTENLNIIRKRLNRGLEIVFISDIQNDGNTDRLLINICNIITDVVEGTDFSDLDQILGSKATVLSSLSTKEFNFKELAKLLHASISKMKPMLLVDEATSKSEGKSNYSTRAETEGLDSAINNDNTMSQGLTTIAVGEGLHCLAAVLYSTLHSSNLTFYDRLEDFKRFVENDRHRLTHDGVVFTIFAKPSDLNTFDLWDLHSLFSNRKLQQQAQIGIMTALRSSTLFRITIFSYLVSLLGFNELRSLVVLPTSTSKFEEKSERTLVLTTNDELNYRINEALKNQYHALIFTGHSYFCRLSLGRKEGAFCPCAVDSSDEHFAQSTCYHPHKYLADCVYDRDFCYYYQNSIAVSRASAYQHNTPFIVIANGCSSIKFGDWYDDFFNVCLNFLESGALTCLGTIKCKLGGELESFLALDLLANEQSMGLIARKLNRLGTYTGDDNCYLLLGDPLLRVKSRRVKSVTSPLKSKVILPNPQLIKAMDYATESNLIKLILRVSKTKIEEILNHKVRLLLNVDGINSPNFVMICDQDSQTLELYIYSPTLIRNGSAPRIHVGLLSSEEQKEIHSIVTDVCNNLQKLQFLSLSSTKTPGLVKDFTNHLVNMSKKHSKTYGIMLLNKSEWQMVLAKIDNIHTHLTKTIESALAENPKIGLEELYAGILSISDRLGKGKVFCPLCSRKLSLRFFYLPLMRTVSRTMAECLRCGPVEDFPGELLNKAISKQRLPVSFKCQETWEANCHYSAIVRVENFTDKYLRSMLSVTVSNAAGREPLISIDPRNLSFTILPKEAKEISFTLDVPPNIKAGTYYLRWLLLTNADITSGARRLFINNYKREGQKNST